jgi:hypothetical protein
LQEAGESDGLGIVSQEEGMCVEVTHRETFVGYEADDQMSKGSVQNTIWIKLTKDGTSRAGVTFNKSFLGSDYDLYHVSLYQLCGSPFMACPAAGSLDLANLVWGLLP